MAEFYTNAESIEYYSSNWIILLCIREDLVMILVTNFVSQI